MTSYLNMAKILNLVLYSNSSLEHNEGYEIMQEILSKYYKTFEPVVQTIFFKYSDISTDYHLENNILHIKGIESLVPGVLEKTLKAFTYVKDWEFDYIIRSNISTIINFNNLLSELAQNPIQFYGGGKLMNLQWTGGGITDSTWYGTDFVCGTSIILTKEAIQLITEKQHMIDKTIVDDLAIAIFMRQYKSEIKPQQFNQALYKTTPCFFTNQGFDMHSMIEFVKSNPDAILYRNRCYNCRKVDQIQMKIIVDILLENNILNL
jgi:hypothetical protein